MLKTHGSRLGYWFTGFALIWAILLVSFIDVLAAPRWHAPNPQCDSLGIPLAQTMMALPLWTIAAALIPAVPVFLFVRKRLPGADIFDLRLGSPPWNWGVSLLTLFVIAPLVFDIVRNVWQVVVPQTISSDCAGRAELLTITMRKPVLQFMPLVEIALGIWVLHIRALLLSPRAS